MRLFIAIDLPEKIQGYFFEIQKKLKDVRKTSSFHLTLKYLGENNSSEYIIDCLRSVKHEPFELTTGYLGAFPNKKIINVLWIGIEHQEKLLDLVEKIDNAIQLKRDHIFHSHITLARAYKKIVFPEIYIEPKKFVTDEFLLYQSILTKQGPVYKILKKFKI